MNETLKASAYEVVAVDEIDYKERIKPSSILQYFQNIATSHAIELGLGYEDMRRDNLFWVISRISFIIDRYPKLDDRLKIVTYPKEVMGVGCVRDYVIEDDVGTLIRGSSKWCLLDFTTKTIKRAKKYFDFDKSRFFSREIVENATPSIPKFEYDSSEFSLSEHTVLLTEIDRNLHMNNARYGDCILNSCDKSLLDNRKLKRLDINYLSELKYGEKYCVKHFNKDDFSAFSAVSGDREVFRALAEWTHDS